MEKSRGKLCVCPPSHSDARHLHRAHGVPPAYRHNVIVPVVGTPNPNEMEDKHTSNVILKFGISPE